MDEDNGQVAVLREFDPEGRVRLLLDISPRLKRGLKILAAQRGTTMNRMIVPMLERMVAAGGPAGEAQG